MASLVRASSRSVAASSASQRPSAVAGVPTQHRAPQHQQEWVGRVVEAAVKWFDPAKGFGFVTADPLGDVFFHVSVVGDHHRPSLLRQARLRVRLGPGPKTLQVVEIIGRLSADDGVPSFAAAGAAAHRAAAAVPEPCAFPF